MTPNIIYMKLTVKGGNSVGINIFYSDKLVAINRITLII